MAPMDRAKPSGSSRRGEDQQAEEHDDPVAAKAGMLDPRAARR